MPIEPEVGSWHIVVTCEHCRSILYLFRDLTEGEGSLNATYCVKCPRCLQKGNMKRDITNTANQLSQLEIP